MKLLMVSQVPDSRLMGVPRVIHCIADVLRERGHQVDLMFEDEVPKPKLVRLAHVEWSIQAAPEIARRCQAQNYDAVVITTMSGWALSSFRRWILPRHTKIISWHHGWEELMWRQMLIEERTGGHRFSARFKLYYGGLILWMLRQSLRTQDGAIFTSTEERDWVQAQYPDIAPHVFYQPNGVSARYFYPERFGAPGLSPTEATKLLFVGYWDPWRKGRKYLVEAFSRLHVAHPDIHLTLAGTKLSAEEILPDFPEDCRDAITVVPSANEGELDALYRAHDAFVLPSLFEGQPLVVLEAMASGLPVVTSDSNGMKDVIQHGQSGLLIPRRDTEALLGALAQLVESPDLRRTLGQNAQAFVGERHTWEQAALVFEQNIQQVIGRPAPTNLARGGVGS